MNRNAIAWGALLCCVGFGISAPAQQKEGSGIITAPAGRMQWRVEVKYEDGKKKPGESAPGENRASGGDGTTVTGLNFVRAEDGLTHVTVDYRAEPSRDFWQTKGHFILKAGKSDRVVVIGHSLEVGGPYPFSSKGFYGFDNVRAKDEQGMAEFDKVQCRYFKGALKPAGGGDVAAPEYEAWFDAATGLPKGYRERGTTFTYRFETGTVPELIMPPEWKAAWERFRKNMALSGRAAL